jgi:aldehyde:ferredoxin oxidoreductase
MKLLRVNLSEKSTSIEDIDEDDLRKYVGGSGLAAKILWDETNHDTDPLGAENVLVFSVGPLTGTPVPSSSRYTVAAKSPLTGIFGEASSGGSFGFQLRRTGFLAVVITGVADAPCYLWIKNKEVEIRDASHLWGMDTYEVSDAILAETEKITSVACIGRAGERMVRIAGVMNDGRDARAAARCGLGAVMGSKKLKAIAVKGNNPPQLFDNKALLSSVKEVIPTIKKAALGLTTYGTAIQVEGNEEIGDLPIKNWRLRTWKKGNSFKISGQHMAETFLRKNYHCTGCPIGCGRTVEYEGMLIGGPEYETIGQLGSNCCVSDLETIIKANDLCNSQVIAFAMEAYERGIINKDDTGGVELNWGSGDAVLEMIRQIGEYEGFGQLLGRGVRAVSIALENTDFAIHVKGLEFPAHDPRAYSSLAVGYATSNRGADHLQALSHDHQNPRGVPTPWIGYESAPEQFQTEGIGVFVAKLQNAMNLYDSLHICKFNQFGEVDFRKHIHKWYNLATGYNTSFEEFLTTGERIVNLKRMYNVREGITRADDTLPKRILTLDHNVEGMMRCELPDLETQLDEYYEYRGWDDNGIPTKETLTRLGLEFTLEALP